MKGVDALEPPRVLCFWADKEIKPLMIKVGYRWFRLSAPVKISILLSTGEVLVYLIKAGFYFDSRSGGFAVDMVLPHLGSELFVMCWLIHDVNAYAQYFSFRDTNALLYSMLDYAGANRFQLLAVKAVGVSDFWYGEPKPGDREYINISPTLRFDREVIPCANL